MRGVKPLFISTLTSNVYFVHKHTLTIVFKADGTGTFNEYETIDSNKCSFTYSMEDTTKGKAYISSRGTTIYFVIESGKMYIYGHGYGKDLDFLLTKQ